MPESKSPKVYFGVQTKEKFYLPDTNEEQWIEVRKLAQAGKNNYNNSIGELSKINVTINDDGTKTFDMIPDPTKMGMIDKKKIDASVVGYNVYVQNEDGQSELKTGFEQTVWDKIYDTMDGDIADGLLKLIIKLNPFMDVSPKSEKKI